MPRLRQNPHPLKQSKMNEGPLVSHFSPLPLPWVLPNEARACISILPEMFTVLFAKYLHNILGTIVRVAALAQLVEHIIRNDGVRCSSHLCGTTFLPCP
jgi:hypothetical protein